MSSVPGEAIPPEDVALRLHVALRTVYRMIRRGELPAVKIGRVWRVPVDALQEYLRGGTVTVPPLERTAAAPSPLSEEERLARIEALCGSLKGTGHVVDDFLREKHEEAEREEARLVRRREAATR